MLAGFQFKYALFICVVVYIIKQRGKIQLGATFYSILLMNMATPLIDRYTKRRVFGGVGRSA